MKKDDVLKSLRKFQTKVGVIALALSFVVLTPLGFLQSISRSTFNSSHTVDLLIGMGLGFEILGAVIFFELRRYINSLKKGITKVRPPFVPLSIYDHIKYLEDEDGNIE